MKNIRAEPKLDEAAAESNLAVRGISLNPIISKLDEHVVLLLINYIASQLLLSYYP